MPPDPPTYFTLATALGKIKQTPQVSEELGLNYIKREACGKMCERVTSGFLLTVCPRYSKPAISNSPLFRTEKPIPLDLLFTRGVEGGGGRKFYYVQIISGYYR